MIYTENYKGRKKPCLALVSVGGGLGWDLSGIDLGWGRDWGNGNSEAAAQNEKYPVLSVETFHHQIREINLR